MMGDMLEDTVKVVGANEGQPDLPKPADIEAFERGQPAPGQPTPPAEDTPAPAKEDEPKPGEAPPPKGDGEQPPDEMETILAKVDKGEALSEEEEALLIVEGKRVEGEQPPPKTHKINNQEFTEDELEARMRKEWGIGDRKLRPEARDKALEDYIKAQNRTEFSRVTQQKSEEVAHREKAVEVQRLQAEQLRAQAQAELQAARAKQKDFEDRVARLTKQADSGATKEGIIDPETQQPDPDRLFEYQEKLRAQRELKEVETEREKLNQSESLIQRKALEADVAAFVAGHPEYATKGDLLTQWDKFSRGEAIDKDDRLRVMELHDFYTQAAQNGMSVENVFALHEARGTLAVKPPAQPEQTTTAPTIPKVLPSAKTWAQMIRAHREKIRSTPTGLPAGGGGDRGKPGATPTSRQIVEHDARIAGTSDDNFLKETLKYEQ
jgi:hypothetical protein